VYKLTDARRGIGIGSTPSLSSLEKSLRRKVFDGDLAAHRIQKLADQSTAVRRQSVHTTSSGVLNLKMLESLLKVVAEVKQRTNGAGRISLFLDFDGTLVPIESNPALPRFGLGNRGSPPGVIESGFPW
jgi:hypothetical protein